MHLAARLHLDQLGNSQCSPNIWLYLRKWRERGSTRWIEAQKIRKKRARRQRGIDRKGIEVGGNLPLNPSATARYFVGLTHIGTILKDKTFMGFRFITSVQSLIA